MSDAFSSPADPFISIQPPEPQPIPSMDGPGAIGGGRRDSEHSLGPHPSSPFAAPNPNGATPPQHVSVFGGGFFARNPVDANTSPNFSVGAETGSPSVAHLVLPHRSGSSASGPNPHNPHHGAGGQPPLHGNLRPVFVGNDGAALAAPHANEGGDSAWASRRGSNWSLPATQDGCASPAGVSSRRASDCPPYQSSPVHGASMPGSANASVSAHPFAFAGGVHQPQAQSSSHQRSASGGGAAGTGFFFRDSPTGLSQPPQQQHTPTPVMHSGAATPVFVGQQGITVNGNVSPVLSTGNSHQSQSDQPSMEDALLAACAESPAISAVPLDDVASWFRTNRPAGMPSGAGHGRVGEQAQGLESCQVFVGQLPSFLQEESLTACLEYIIGRPGSVVHSVVRRSTAARAAPYALVTLTRPDLTAPMRAMNRHFYVGRRHLFVAPPEHRGEGETEFQRIVARVVAADNARPTSEQRTLGYARACIVVGQANPPPRQQQQQQQQQQAPQPQYQQQRRTSNASSGHGMVLPHQQQAPSPVSFTGYAGAAQPQPVHFDTQPQYFPQQQQQQQPVRGAIQLPAFNGAQQPQQQQQQQQQQMPTLVSLSASGQFIAPQAGQPIFALGPNGVLIPVSGLQ